MYVYRAALAFLSPYFAGLFRNDLKERVSAKLEDHEVTDMKAITKYSGEITLSEETESGKRSTSLFVV
uniref:BTB domain-containing protein n=1 Tax=Glossina pallidipes TaxID=7398 RepID=A0A1A9ZP84_GLOPL